MSGTERARNVLHAAGSQIGEFEGSIELVVVFDDREVDGATLRAIVDEYVPRGVPRRFIGRAGSRYYEQKNAGAAAAEGDVVVFVDSDTIPEPGWLRELLRPFDDPAVEVVAGATYTNYRTVPDKAFAVTWNFPLRPDDGPIHSTVHFNANCVAFRRATWAEHPFPEDARFRGQCHSLALELAANGIPVLANPLARVAHPPPKGIR
jgi:glycosyltransferase involved in cell wall biosynthesis